jgi:membrane protein
MDRSDVEAVSLWRRLRGLLVSAGKEWMNDRSMSKAAALAFYTLFSLGPVMLMVLAIAGLAFGEEAARGALFNELSMLVGPSGAQAIELVLANARNLEAGLVATVISLGLLIVGATTVFGELKDSLDEIWKVPPSRQSGITHFVRTRLLSFGMILVLAFLLLVSLAVDTALAVLERSLGGLWDPAGYVLMPIAAGVSFIVITLLFASIYKLLPSVRLPWRDVWVGAIITAFMFEAGKSLIGAYLGHNAFINSFGAASSIIALMMWVYYSSLIFFFGAEITRQYALWFGSKRRASGSAPSS